MLRMQRILRIAPGGKTLLAHAKKIACCSCRGDINAPGDISLIRCIRSIRVPPLNLDAGGI